MYVLCVSAEQNPTTHIHLIQILSFHPSSGRHNNIIIQSAVTTSKWVTQSPLLQIRCRFNWSHSDGFIIHRWPRYNGKISLSNINALVIEIGSVLFVDVHEKELETYLNRRLDKEMKRRNIVEYYSTSTQQNGTKLFVSWIGYIQPLSQSREPFILDCSSSAPANHYRLSQLQLLSFFRAVRVDSFDWKLPNQHVILNKKS